MDKDKKETQAENAEDFPEEVYEIFDQLTPALSGISKSAKKTIAETSEHIAAADKEITKFCGSEDMDKLQAIFPDAREWIEQERDTQPDGITHLAANLVLISEHLDAIKDYVEKSGFKGSIADFMKRGKNPKTGREQLSNFEDCMLKVDPQKVTVNRAKKVEYPLDKVNNEIWNLLEKDTGGQLTLKAEKANSKKPLDIIYAINFDALDDTGITITKRLTSFDKRVYIAISALYNAGNNVISLNQIYYAMGNTATPDKRSRERIHESITKMTGAKIFVNNSMEAAEYKYPKFVYDGALLPIERATEIINGNMTDSAIHIFREPPVMSFAKQRKQVTTIDVKLLQSPISKTEENLSIDDYLIERISRAKKGRQPHKILYSTICDKLHITGSKQKGRLPGKVKRYLEHYKACGMISGYTEEPDGVTVSFNPEISTGGQKNYPKGG